MINEGLSIESHSQNQLSPMEQHKVVEFLDLVHYVTKRIVSRLPRHIDFEDMMNCGVMGLIDAVTKFDWSADKPNKEFKAYAECRIRGQILDELRKLDILPRSARDKVSLYKKSFEKLSSKLGRDPSDVEIAFDLGIDIEECHKMKKDQNHSRSISIDTHIADAPEVMEGLLSRSLYLDTINNTPEKMFHIHQIKEVLANEITKLPEREKVVISLYYIEDINLKDIGEVLEISESRVSQIHSQALDRLMKRVKFIMSDNDICSMLNL